MKQENRISKAIFLFLLFFHQLSFSGIFGPSNYNECILDGMKGVNSDFAAKVIASTCMDKFPESISNSKTASTSSTVKCGIQNNRCYLKLNNGNLSCRPKDQRDPNTNVYVFNNNYSGIRINIQVPEKMSDENIRMFGTLRSHEISEFCQ